MTKRISGTVVRGLRAPIFHENDNLEIILPKILVELKAYEGVTIQDHDILAITESVVARTQGNYATMAQISADLKSKLPPTCQHLGLCLPIMSRNRFAPLLSAFASTVAKLTLLLAYPADEMGNPLITAEQLAESELNPVSDCLTELEFRARFGTCLHPFTGLDYVAYYREVIEAAGASCQIIFGSDPSLIVPYCSDIITCDVHSRHLSKMRLRAAGAKTVLGLDDLLNTPSSSHGYNCDYGLLGSNKADEDRIKLFPRDCDSVVNQIAQRLKEIFKKDIEVMIYGDGAFKDPVGQIWELADPVVSPGYTAGLSGQPNELKLKYLADSEYHDLDPLKQGAAIKARIKQKTANLAATMVAEGTTPRRITDLLGSLADLTSGSGDKGTPLVYIQGYFDNYADE